MFSDNHSKHTIFSMDQKRLTIWMGDEDPWIATWSPSFTSQPGDIAWHLPPSLPDTSSWWALWAPSSWTDRSAAVETTNHWWPPSDQRIHRWIIRQFCCKQSETILYIIYNDIYIYVYYITSYIHILINNIYNHRLHVTTKAVVNPPWWCIFACCFDPLELIWKIIDPWCFLMPMKHICHWGYHPIYIHLYSFISIYIYLYPSSVIIYDLYSFIGWTRETTFQTTNQYCYSPENHDSWTA